VLLIGLIDRLEAERAAGAVDDDVDLVELRGQGSDRGGIGDVE
jgi:hypothetical protein